MNQYTSISWPGGPATRLMGFGDGFPDALIGAPSFSFMSSGVTGAQQAYRIVLERSDEGSVWDSGWVESARSHAIEYRGAPLEYNHDYRACAQIRTDEGVETPLSDPVCFSTGLEHWVAIWLVQSTGKSAAPMFRHEFSVREEISRARLFISGLGYYEASINGQRVGDRRMDTAWTDYDKRVCYSAYDILPLIRPGGNAIGVLLGNGWYASKLHRRPILSAVITLTYRDGSTDCLTTDPNAWRFFGGGPILDDTIYIGEVYDARREQPGWDRPGFDDSKWTRPLEAEPPKGKMVPTMCEPVRTVERLPPQRVTGIGPDTFVVDFGQNLSGLVRLSSSARDGDTVRIRYSEILHPDGSLNMLNLRDAQQCDEYVAAGGAFTYEPRFTYHGFRYAEVSGLKTLEPGQIEALVIRNDMPVRGRFTCANQLINSIQRICFWTESNNLHWVPTDCPQRDERLGWLNDLTVRAEEAVYNFDIRRFFDKFLTDIRDEQGEVTGAITDTVPYKKYGCQPADGVCSSYLVLAWLLYMNYGDPGVLSRYYDGLKGWAEYMSRQREGGIVAYSYYGDWASPITESVKGSLGSGAVSGTTPGQLMSTGFLLYNARLMKQMAQVLGRAQDQARYEALEAETVDALNRVYLNREKGFYASNSQAANTFMLYLGAAPEEHKPMVVENLVQDIRARGIHTSTGNICSRYIYEVLCDNGHADLAYELVTQTTYPSWGYMLSMGATTTWERWEYVDSGEQLGMASHDHPMYSTISAWFYRYLAGIRTLTPGFERFAVRPSIPKGLDSAEASLNTVKGEIMAAWSREGDALTVWVKVPFGSVCELALPLEGQAAQVLVNGQPCAEYAQVDGRVLIELLPGQHAVRLA